MRTTEPRSVTLTFIRPPLLGFDIFDGVVQEVQQDPEQTLRLRQNHRRRPFDLDSDVLGGARWFELPCNTIKDLNRVQGLVCRLLAAELRVGHKIVEHCCHSARCRLDHGDPLRHLRIVRIAEL